jgi:group I intron endonuclease
MLGIIYLITNKITGEMYVGQTIQKLETRWKRHLKVTSCCTRLSNAINKYTSEQFYIDQIDFGNSFEELNVKEVYWIKVLNTLSPNGYNLQIGGKNGQPSKETRIKIGNARRGIKHTDEAKKKMSDGKIGKKLSEEARKKLSQSRIGLKRSEEAKKRMSLAQQNRKPISEETRIKFGNAKRGIKHTEESKKKMSLSQSGRKHSEETKQKMRIANPGRKHTEEAKKKMREIYAKRKALLMNNQLTIFNF